MSKEAKILAYALTQGVAANRAEKVATMAADDFYALSNLDADGSPLPTGLPLFVKAKENYTLISGDEALALLNSFGLEE